MNSNDLISRAALLKEIEPDMGAMRGVCFFGGRSQGKTLAMNLEALKMMIIQAPAVDAVEVIRCKDCENFGCSPFSYSPSKGWCKLEGEPRRADYYCASGRKKECG